MPKKKLRKSKDDLKKEVVWLMVENEGFDNVELNEKAEKAEKVAKCEYANLIRTEYERLMKSQKPNITCLSYRRGLNLSKFKESEKF